MVESLPSVFSPLVAATRDKIGVFYINITKTCLYNFDHLKPHFYILKLGCKGYTLFFLFLLKNIDCGYSLEPPSRGGSNENENPQSVLWAEI